MPSPERLHRRELLNNPSGEVLNASELAAVIAKSLSAAGSNVLFGIPGGGNNLEVIGAAEAAGIQFVLAHTENAAAYMACVYAELTRIPTGCVITRGPGAASATNGVAQAFLDRQPLLMLTDAVSSTDAARISHQRLDQHAVFSGISKWSGVLGKSEPADVMDQAIAIAAGPRPGPVHLDFDPGADHQMQPPAPVAPYGDIRAARAVLATARLPVVLVGIGARDHASAVRKLLAGTNVPVLQTYKAKGVVPDSWPNAAGILTGATVEAPVLEAADVILAIGLDTVELIPNQWPYSAPVVALNSWPEDSPYFEPQVTVVGPLDELLAGLSPPLPDEWDPGFAQEQRAATAIALLSGPKPTQGLAPWDVVARTRALAPAGSIATVDAGAHMLAAMPLWDTEEPGEVLISSGLATLGFALPAAIAAAIARPDKRTYCFVGDGGLGMVLAELETVVRLDLPITIVVFNDSALSLIQIKQKTEGHGGSNAISYRLSDFAAIARAYGLDATNISSIDELEAAVQDNLDHPRPILLDIQLDGSGYPYVMDVIRGQRAKGV
jgi:acetolactate synthase-1/2/3 large subunit